MLYASNVIVLSSNSFVPLSDRFRKNVCKLGGPRSITKNTLSKLGKCYDSLSLGDGKSLTVSEVVFKVMDDFFFVVIDE